MRTQLESLMADWMNLTKLAHKVAGYNPELLRRLQAQLGQHGGNLVEAVKTFHDGVYPQKVKE